MGKLYSTEKIMTYVDNNIDQCNELLELFVETIPMELNKLNTEITNKNWAKANEIIHRIKPSFEIIQIKEGTEEFIKLNNNINSKIDLDKSEELFNNMETHIYQAIKQIKEDIGK